MCNKCDFDSSQAFKTTRQNGTFLQDKNCSTVLSLWFLVHQQITKTGDIAQFLEYLASIHETLGFIPTLRKSNMDEIKIKKVF